MKNKYKIIFLSVVIVASHFKCLGQLAYKWKVDTLANQPSLRGISVLNQNAVWVSGTNGTIAKTVDGGANWKIIEIPKTDALDFRDIEVLSEKEVVVMSAGTGDLSNIYKTKDGGINWKKVKSNVLASGFYDGFTFSDVNEGMLGGDPIDNILFLLKTADGGNSWKRIEPALLPVMKEGEYGGFAASGSHLKALESSIWVGTGGASARIFYSSDKGKKWNVVDTPMIQGLGSQGIFSVDFYNTEIGIAVGGDYTKENEGVDNVILTSDGGKTWRLAAQFPVYQSAVRYTDKSNLISVGPAACYNSTDGGNTWNKIAGPGFHTLSVSKDGTAWAAGRDGIIGELVIDKEGK
jgi:photosystem II stability/assembly factor-like uncharacterized protein